MSTGAVHGHLSFCREGIGIGRGRGIWLSVLFWHGGCWVERCEGEVHFFGGKVVGKLVCGMDMWSKDMQEWYVFRELRKCLFWQSTSSEGDGGVSRITSIWSFMRCWAVGIEQWFPPVSSLWRDGSAPTYLGVMLMQAFGVPISPIVCRLSLSLFLSMICQWNLLWQRFKSFTQRLTTISLS